MIPILTFCCLYIIAHSVLCINRMDRETCNCLWAGYALISSAAIYLAYEMLALELNPTVGTSVLIVGLSVKCFVGSRVCKVTA